MAPRVYKRFIEFVKDIKAIEYASEILRWDQEVYMPPKGVEQRAHQMAVLSDISHRKFISAKMRKYIEELNKDSVLSELTPEERCNVREITRMFKKESKKPPRLVRELTKTISLATSAWVKAKRKSDYNLFVSWFDKIVKLKKDIVDKIGYEKERYDTLLDDFEPHTLTDDVNKVLKELERMLVPIVDKIINSGVEISTEMLHRKYPVDKQREFGVDVVKRMGYDFDRGRLDITEHPFTTGKCDDVRITTKYDEHDINLSLFSMIHEAGHALYEQGLNSKYYGTPMAEYVSLGIHESQSRLWENIIGRSMEFWEYYYPKMKDIFSAQLRDIDLIDFYRAINRVKQTFIRIESDEVTYNLHIILRFEIEKQLMNDKISPKEVPQIWNEKMNMYLKITPPDDAKGALQDVHWSSGYIGYFPTYTLGNLYAAQIFNQMCNSIDNLKQEISAGNFATVKNWLYENIHQYGMLYTADELIRRISGESLNPRYFIDYIKTKYSDIYGITL